MLSQIPYITQPSLAFMCDKTLGVNDINKWNPYQFRHNCLH